MKGVCLSLGTCTTYCVFLKAPQLTLQYCYIYMYHCVRVHLYISLLFVLLSSAQVDHFSKYKLVADDDDESEGEENETKKAKTDGKVG